MKQKIRTGTYLTTFGIRLYFSLAIKGNTDNFSDSYINSKIQFKNDLKGISLIQM